MVLWPHEDDRLTKASKIATIAVAVIAILTLPPILINMNSSIEQLETGLESTKNLGGLIESSQNQTIALENAIREIRHQTILDAYTSGGVFSLKIADGCSTSGKEFDRDENFLAHHIAFKPIMVSESGAQTIVPFRIYAKLIFEGKNEIDAQGRNFDSIDLGTFKYEPNSENPVEKVAIHEMLDQADELDYEFVEINYRYSFRPYSPAFNENSIADQSEHQIKQMALMQHFEDGWQGLDLRDKYECKN